MKKRVGFGTLKLFSITREMNKNTLQRYGAAWLVCVSALSPCLAQTQAAPAPFVTINGEPQSILMAEVLLREQLARGAANSPQLQAAVKDTLIRQTLMAQEAGKAGLDRQPGVQAQMALARQNILAQAWQQQFLQEARLQEDDLRNEYQRQTRLLGPREYRVRHLLVQEEATAKLLIEKIRSGTRMADLAAEYSRDEATRQQGGLTPWTPQGQLMPSIAQALTRLQPGGLAPSPVSSPAGWHVVQLEEGRDYKAPALEQVKPQLVQALLQQRLNEKLEQLRTAAKVE